MAAWSLSTWFIGVLVLGRSLPSLLPTGALLVLLSCVPTVSGVHRQNN